jgi:predicted dienelactone hydrolase
MNHARIFLSLALALLISSVLNAQPNQQATPLHKVGVVSRTFKLDVPYNWRGAKTHALNCVVWYPANPASVEQPQWIGPPDKPLFTAGRASQDAALFTSPEKFPLIVLSHGLGGAALGVSWLGTALASHGYIAVAVNHPGNNADDDYTPQGFALWWERAKDVSTVIDKMLADSTFGSRINPKRIGGIGYSLGGYTMIEIAGSTFDLATFRELHHRRLGDKSDGPPAFPNLFFEQFDILSKTDADFQESVRHAGDSYRDPRVRAVVAIAPSGGPMSPATPLERISIPVVIIAGEADEVVPVASHAKYFAAHIPSAKLIIFPGAVGHLVFLQNCTDEGRKSLDWACVDGPGVDREAIHARTLEIALSFFAASLN